MRKKNFVVRICQVKKAQLKFKGIVKNTCEKKLEWEKEARELARFMYENIPSVYWTALHNEMILLSGRDQIVNG